MNMDDLCDIWKQNGYQIGLINMTAGGQRRTTIEDTDVIQSQKTTLKHIVAF